MDFKDKLIYSRAMLKLTQAGLAEELGVSLETVNRWESGRFRPSKRSEYSFNIFCSRNNLNIEDK